MRMKRGSNINFFNKDGEWLSEIVFLDRDRVEVKFLNKLKEPTKNSNIELAICLVKKNPMDTILQKATALGVNKITPIVSERTEVKELNCERAKKIVIEATEQSNQLIPPIISQVKKLKDFLNNLDGSTKLLFADVNSKDNLKKELIETESFALMNDDFSNLEDMLLDNSSIEEIANEISKELFSSDLYSIESYDFEINEPAIQEYLFSNEITLDQPIAIESGDSIIFMAYDRLEEPYLKTFQDVAEDTADYLSESKAIEKISLLQEEILENSETDDSKSFVDTYSYVSQESYVDVKRYSSLLPREVLREIFDSSSGSTLNLSANNGDRYIINLNSFTKPSEEDIQEIINEYTAFGEDSFATKMQQIINEDIFQKADENLNDLLQF